jgi:ribonuclease-3
VGLARLAGRIDLGQAVLLGQGESQRSGRRRPSLLASSFEALVGALYLDLGFERVRAWLVEIAAPELDLDAPIGSLKSPKSRLQEYTQRRSGERPEYRLLDASGPDHEKSFRIEVWVGGEVLGVGAGSSRREAETAAAAEAIERIRAGRRASPLTIEAAGT